MEHLHSVVSYYPAGIESLQQFHSVSVTTGSNSTSYNLHCQFFKVAYGLGSSHGGADGTEEEDKGEEESINTEDCYSISISNS